ncbi:hypothetical protein V8G54_009129 [Vigna mungo]|uniref:TIR domain-containing protein n=1 Tax=Vigna mungo TaxID=3915 RepID=A0AAQ3NWL8_VIGMU
MEMDFNILSQLSTKQFQQYYCDYIITYVRGRVISLSSSAGTCGFKGIRRETPFAIQTAAENAIRTVSDQGMQRAEIMIKGPGLGRDVALRAIRRSVEVHFRSSTTKNDDEMEMDFLSDRYQKMNGGNFKVFLSFRGKDTRASFTSHLYTALQNAGIFVFKDDESLPQGKQISLSLRQAIEESPISIVVFSKNYAESWWCLKELEIIMECHKTIGNMVLPVFYDVDPSEVRHQKGDFGKAFQRLLSKFSKEEEQKVLDWKNCWWNTLREICDISAVEILSPSRIKRVDKLDNKWEKTLLEVVQISKILDLNPRGKMKIADSIEFLVRQSKEGLFKGAEITFRKEKVDGMDFLMKQWREVFCEPFRISEVVGRVADTFLSGGSSCGYALSVPDPTRCNPYTQGADQQLQKALRARKSSDVDDMVVPDRDDQNHVIIGQNLNSNSDSGRRRCRRRQ